MGKHWTRSTFNDQGFNKNIGFGGLFIPAGYQDSVFPSTTNNKVLHLSTNAKSIAPVTFEVVRIITLGNLEYINSAYKVISNVKGPLIKPGLDQISSTSVLLFQWLIKG